MLTMWDLAVRAASAPTAGRVWAEVALDAAVADRLLAEAEVRMADPDHVRSAAMAHRLDNDLDSVFQVLHWTPVSWPAASRGRAEVLGTLEDQWRDQRAELFGRGAICAAPGCAGECGFGREELVMLIRGLRRELRQLREEARMGGGDGFSTLRALPPSEPGGGSASVDHLIDDGRVVPVLGIRGITIGVMAADTGVVVIEDADSVTGDAVPVPHAEAAWTLDARKGPVTAVVDGGMVVRVVAGTLQVLGAPTAAHWGRKPATTRLRMTE